MPKPQDIIRYVPAQEGAQPKIIQMVEVQKDPLEPPRFKINQKVPRAPPSPPAPIMHSPPRKITAEEQKQWKIPPCVSSWKNPRGYVVPLDKRCAFNGRTGTQPETINPKFAQLSETLYISAKQHRAALEEQMKAEKLIAQKEKEKNEEKLRMLAQQAREERAIVQRGLGHGRDDSGEDEDVDSEELRERRRIRDERHRERVRNVNIKSSNPERRTRFDRNRERDISEQVALGMARPNADNNDVHDQRLYEQSEGLGSGFEHDDDYTVYDQPWKSQASFSTNYRPSAALLKDAKEREEQEKSSDATANPADDPLEPIQFEKEEKEEKQEVEDVFNVESFLRNAKYNARKLQDNSSGSKSSKRHRHH